PASQCARRAAGSARSVTGSRRTIAPATDQAAAVAGPRSTHPARKAPCPVLPPSVRPAMTSEGGTDHRMLSAMTPPSDS
ncbi:MAG: hypothetical protein ACRDFT_01405, partial [bacterium]